MFVTFISFLQSLFKLCNYGYRDTRAYILDLASRNLILIFFLYKLIHSLSTFRKTLHYVFVIWLPELMVIIQRYFLGPPFLSSLLKLPMTPFSKNFINSDSIGLAVLFLSFLALCFVKYQCLIHSEPKMTIFHNLEVIS